MSALDLSERDGGLKQRILADLLQLADALPEDEWPPEASLEALMRRNRRAGKEGRECVRPWRLGGCRHCPNEAEIGELRRSASERRRAGGFSQLAPSSDPEWSALLEEGRPKGDARAQPHGRASPDELLREWLLVLPGNASGAACDAHCVAARWDALLCPAI